MNEVRWQCASTHSKKKINTGIFLCPLISVFHPFCLLVNLSTLIASLLCLRPFWWLVLEPCYVCARPEALNQTWLALSLKEGWQTIRNVFSLCKLLREKSVWIQCIILRTVFCLVGCQAYGDCFVAGILKLAGEIIANSASSSVLEF